MRIDIANIPKAFRTLDDECRRHVGSIAYLSFANAVAAVGNAFIGNYAGVENAFRKQEGKNNKDPEISMKPIVVAGPHRKGNTLAFNCNKTSAEVMKTIARWAIYSHFDKLEAQMAKVEYKNGRVIAEFPDDFDEEHLKFKNVMRVVDAINNVPAKMADDAICKYEILENAVIADQQKFEAAFEKFAAEVALARNI